MNLCNCRTTDASDEGGAQINDASSTTGRREFLAAATLTCCATAGRAAAVPGERVVIDGVDRFRVSEPLFEGIRIVLQFRGEKYSPAYIQGISGAAFRIAGICPCAPDCSSQMSTTDLLKLVGYKYEESILGWTGDVDDAKKNMIALIPRIRDSIRAGRPVPLWYAFVDTGYEVVTGFDDAQGVFLGYHFWQRKGEALAKAKQTRAEEAAKICPAFGAIFVGEKTGKLDARAAEVAALKEAVRHAHDTTVRTQGPPRQGLTCYDWWVESFKSPNGKRDAGSAYCQAVYRTTHRAAAGFLKEIAPRHRPAADRLRAAASEFAAEADALDAAGPLINRQSPEMDSARNEKLWPILARARDHYAAGITEIEQALPSLA